MVSIATKIGAFSMFSTMALGRQLSTIEIPDFGAALTKQLQSLANDIEALKKEQ